MKEPKKGEREYVSRAIMRVSIMDRLEHLTMAAEEANENGFVRYTIEELEALRVMLKMCDNILMKKR